jgi:hypothetical protein
VEAGEEEIRTGNNEVRQVRKLASLFIVIMLVAMACSLVFIPIIMTTSVEKTDTVSAYVKANQTNVRVMNFTITTQSDIKIAGITPSIGQILENSGQGNDWGFYPAQMLCYDRVRDGGDYNWSADCIWVVNASFPHQYYDSYDTILNGTAPPEGTNPSTTPGCYWGCKAPAWHHIKTFDAVNGGNWSESTDAIIYDGPDNNNAYMDQLRAVTFVLNSSSNGTQSDISALSLWRESGGHVGFQSNEDTRLKTVTYTVGTSSWNVIDINADINTLATFYATVNISGYANHHKTLRFWIPTKIDTGTIGQYDYGDQGLFLAGSNDTGNLLNTNYITTDVYAPETHVNLISEYWKTNSPIAMSANATDNCSGIASVALCYRFSSNNMSWGLPVFFSANTTPWIHPNAVSWSFNFPNGSGYYGFFSRGTDNISNVEAVRTTNDTICGYDITNPDTVIVIPASNGAYHSLTNIMGTGNDTYSGLSSITLTLYNATNSKYWNGTTWGASASPLTVNGTATWYKTSGLPVWLTGNTYIINSTSTDYAGNTQTATQSHTFTYDTDAPTGSISIPMNNTWYNAMKNISGTASDTGGSGLSNVRISIYNSTDGKYYNGTAWSGTSSWITATGTTSWYYSDVPPWTNNSTYIVNLSLQDNANNYNNATDSNLFKMDTAKPVSQLTPIVGYWKTSSPLVLSYTASENGTGSGLNNVTLYYYYSTTNTTFTGPFIFDVDTIPWTPTSFGFTFPYASGFYRFYTRAADNATNIEVTPTVNDTICGYDVANPTATIILPQDNGSYRAGTAIDTNITGTAYNVRGVNLVNISIYNSTSSTFWTGSVWQTAVANLTTNLSGDVPTTNWWFENPTAFPTWATNNSYTITVNVRDTAGNWNNSAATATFRYDTDAPTTMITTPTDSTWYNVMTNTTGSAVDTGGSGVWKVNITIYNATASKYWTGNAWGDSATNLTAIGTTSWYYTAVPPWTNNTNYTINASSTDNAHNVGTKDSHTISIDMVVPQSQVDTISGYWKINALTITATAPPDIGSGLKDISLYYYYSSDNISFVGPILFDVNTSPWIGISWLFIFPNGSGYYRFFSRAADNATNIETIPSINDTLCGYDAGNPASSVNPIAPYWRTSSPVAITATANNGVSGVKNVTLYSRFSLDNSSWDGWMNTGTDIEYPWSWVITFTNGTGYYEFYSIAKDNASKTEEPPGSADTFCGYDNIAPASSVNTVTPYWKNTSPIPVMVTANDTTSGIQNVTLYYRYSTTNTSWDGWVQAGFKTSSPWSWSFSFVNDSGYYEFYSIAQDNATNTETYPGSAEALCGYEYTPPTCMISYNRSATYLQAGTILKIHANFTETLSGMNETSIIITISTGGTGSLPNTTMSKINNTHWYTNWTIPSGSDNDGIFTVKIYAQDNAANTLAIYPTTDATKKIDNTAPICSIAYNRFATFFKEGDELRIYANFTETGSGINQSSVKIRIETQGDGGLANHSMTRTDNTHWSYTWTIPSGDDNDGVFSVKIYARDNTSNPLNPFPTSSDIKKIDNTKPTSSVTAISGYWKTISPVNISYTASDPGSGSGLKNCTLYTRFSTNNLSWDGWMAQDVDYDPWTTRQWSEVFSNGSGHYQFYSIARDNASNEELLPGSADAVCGFDDADPSVTIIIPENNTYYATMNQLNGTCYDIGSGVKSVNITIYNATSHQYWNGTSYAWEPGVQWIASTLGYGDTTWSYNSSAVTWRDTQYYWINVTVKDNTMRTTSLYKCNFTILTTGPTCTIEYNNSRAYYHYSDIVRIDANFTTPVGINEETVRFNITTANGFYWNQSKGDSSVGRTDNTHWYYNFPVPQNTGGDNFDGVITVSVFAQDNISNYLSPYPTSDTSKAIDSTPPTVSIEYNTTLTYFNFYPSLKIYANFTEYGSGINQTSLYLLLETHNTTINTSLTKVDALHYYYNWAIPNSTEDGVLTVRIFAKDNASNSLDPYPTVNASKSIDVTAPESMVEAISGYWKKASVMITATSTDVTSGVKNVTLFYYNSTDNSTWSGPWDFGANSTDAYSWIFNFPNDTGYYRFYTLAVDHSNNYESAPPLSDTSCGYDYTNPLSSVDNISPYWQKGSSITVNVTATDDLSGLKNVKVYWRYRFDNYSWGEWQNITLTSSPWSLTFHSPDDGYYQFYSIAIDNAVNIETALGSPDAICGYDTVAPSVAITIPINGGYYATLSKINGTASDITSGVMQVNITLYNMTSQTYWNDTSEEWESTAQWLTATGNTSWFYNTTAVLWENAIEYAINATAIDYALLTSSTQHHTFSIDNAPPIISSVSLGTPSTTSAIITWTTNENATGSVQYGTTPLYGLWSNSSILTAAHSRTLSNLTEGTMYHYRILSADFIGNLATSIDYSFTTGSTGGGEYFGGGTTIPLAPTADADGPYVGYINGIITFSGSKSKDTDGTIVGYRWDWTDDGSYDTNWSSNDTMTHVYTTRGVYTAKLQVKDNDNLTDTDTTTVTIIYHPGIRASQSVLSAIQTQFGVTLTKLFYANDTNGDDIVDTFTDPNQKLTLVRIVDINGDVSFLLSTENDKIPEFFWDTKTNTITLVTNTPAALGNVSIDTNAREVTIEINVQKAGWIYLTFDDAYPLNQFPDFTLTLKTSDERTLPSNHIWRENNTIFALDDSSMIYLIIYNYTTLPTSFQQPNGAIFQPTFSPVYGTTFTSKRPTIVITYFEPVTVTIAMLNNQNIVAQITSTNSKTFTYTPASELASGSYLLTITVRNKNGNILTSTASYIVSLPTPQTPWLLYLTLIIVIVLVIALTLYFLRKNLFI